MISWAAFCQNKWTISSPVFSEKPKSTDTNKNMIVFFKTLHVPEVSASMRHSIGDTANATPTKPVYISVFR